MRIFQGEDDFCRQLIDEIWRAIPCFEGGAKDLRARLPFALRPSVEESDLFVVEAENADFHLRLRLRLGLVLGHSRSRPFSQKKSRAGHRPSPELSRAS